MKNDRGSTSKATYSFVFLRSWRTVASFLIPIVLSPLALSPYKELKCAYVVCLMSLFWLLEPIPVSVTALIPVALFPLFDIMSTYNASILYMKPSCMLLLAGLLAAIAIESSNLHKRISLNVLLFIGLSIKRIMFSLMITTVFLSMWISNTATTAMMVPVVIAIVDEIENNSKAMEMQVKSKSGSISETLNTNGEIKLEVDPEIDSPKKFRKLKSALMISVAYASGIGGVATLTGTATNLVLLGQMEATYPTSRDINFAKWSFFALPGTLVCFLVGWIYLVWFYSDRQQEQSEDQTSLQVLLQKRKSELGPITSHEYGVIGCFIALVSLWLLKEPGFMPGWESLLHGKEKIHDATPAIVIVLLMFMIPANFKQFTQVGTKTKTLLDWNMASKKVSWGVLLLLGGGFSLAEATTKSGLSTAIGQKLLSLNIKSPVIAMIFLTIFASLLSEIASNVATASLLLPIVNQIALEMHQNPLYMMVPVTTAVSYAFMFPVSSPPNAIVFEQLKLRPIEMIIPGAGMKILCLSITFLQVFFWGPLVFNLKSFPDWAKQGAAMNSTQTMANSH